MSQQGTTKIKLGADLVRRTVGFCRALRKEGLVIGPGESAKALEALAAIDVTDRVEFYLGLRSVLATDHSDYPTFNAVFARFWGPLMRQEQTGEMEEGEGAGGGSDVVEGPSTSFVEWAQGDAAEEEQPVPGYSPAEVLSSRDFSTMDEKELDEVSRLAARIARRLAQRVARRSKFVKKHRLVDARRTMRLALKYAGDPLELAYKEKKIQKTRIVLVCDVSGSMDLFSRFLLLFVYALRMHLRAVEAFIFSTRLTRVTEDLEERTFADAMRSMGMRAAGWSGGTRIGDSLAAFVENYGRSLLDARTVVVILSDGWDTGEVDRLEWAMREIGRQAGRVVWLNPLLGSPSYQPLTRGMRAALPYLDVFAPAHNLDSLKMLEEHLVLKGFGKR